MFDLLVRDDAAAVPVPLPGRVMVFAGADGLYSKDQAGAVRKFEGQDGQGWADTAALGVYMTQSQSVQSGVQSRVIMEGVAFNRGFSAPVSGSGVVVDLSGLYLADWGVSANDSNLSGLSVRLKVNGADAADSSYGAVLGGWARCVGSRLVLLNAGSVVSVWANAWGTNPVIATNANGLEGFLTLVRVGAFS